MSFPSEQFFAQLRRHEGFYSAPYVCPAGAATIGYGTNLEAYPAYIADPDIRAKVDKGRLKGRPLVDALLERGMRWSRADAEAAMAAEVDLCIAQLEKRCPAYGTLIRSCGALNVRPSESGKRALSLEGGQLPAPAGGHKENLHPSHVRAECLVNMCFNMGIGRAPAGGEKGRGLLSFANTLALIERGDFKAAASNMLQSLWARQVKGRAVELAQQMRTGKYQA